MSTRIIIEKDGERYVANDLEARFLDNGRFLGIEEKNDKYYYLGSTFTKLPHVERTDNSAKCDCKDCSFRGMELCEHRKLMDENAKLREALKPIVECRYTAELWFSNCAEAVRDAQDVINGISRKDEDISRKGGAE